jgi:hypothetical protein
MGMPPDIPIHCQSATSSILIDIFFKMLRFFMNIGFSLKLSKNNQKIYLGNPIYRARADFPGGARVIPASQAIKGSRS